MSLFESLDSYFSQAAFMPHGHCYLWRPALVWTHVITDLLIGSAYVGISVTLYVLIRKIRLPFSAMVLAFGIFIAACGATHFMEVWNLWQADYWTAALVKALTAAASVATCLWLVQLRPQIFAVAESARLSEQRREALELINLELERRTGELQRTNEALAEQQKLLAHSAKMSALGEMAGGIAHEINSPLAIITIRAKVLARLCQRGGLTPQVVEREAELLAKTAMRIGDIIKGLRAFAREGSHDAFEFASVKSMIEDALVLCQTRFKNRDVLLEVGDVSDDVSAHCRPVQITQVILNLLSNAFDAVVEANGERWVKVSVEQRDAHIEIAVTDSGLGIPRDLQQKIMQPFFTTKEVGKGTGLGLSISKGIAESHRGSLELDTMSPHTRFVLRLPKSMAMEGADEESS
ncbi:MAG: ATP-binding protein [Deltaproteobacteria bacterium]|nr:ATP-binding protein [Deltaproteobacteria bacterium]